MRGALSTRFVHEIAPRGQLIGVGGYLTTLHRHSWPWPSEYHMSFVPVTSFLSTWICLGCFVIQCKRLTLRNVIWQQLFFCLVCEACQIYKVCVQVILCARSLSRLDLARSNYGSVHQQKCAKSQFVARMTQQNIVSCRYVFSDSFSSWVASFVILFLTSLSWTATQAGRILGWLVLEFELTFGA